MNLVDQIFEQAKLGTAVDPGANPFATGVSLGQHQQALDMQKQQLAMEIAQAPLRQTLLQQEAAYKAAQTEGLLHQQQARVQTQQEFANLAALVSKSWTEATPEDSIPLFPAALQKAPMLADNPQFWELYKHNQTSIQAHNVNQHYQAWDEARGAEKDKIIREAKRVGELTAQLRDSQRKTLEPDEGNPEYRAELDKQQAIQAELGALQKTKPSAMPEIRVIEGKKVLVNPVTGAIHEIKGVVSKREFIAQHVGEWMRDNPGMTQDQVAANLGAFYDQYLGEQTAPAGSTTAPLKGAYRYNPATGKIETTP